MGKKLDATVGGVHKIGKKGFLTGEDLLHHKVKKAFLTKDGVHRLVFSSVTVWEKWDCEIESNYTYERTTDGVGETTTDSCRYDSLLYSDYSFKSGGFEAYGGSISFASIGAVSESDVVGKYIVYPTEVYEIISLDSTEGDFYYVTCEIVDACYQIEKTTYAKGSGTYGTFEVEDGALPESGTLIEGSAADGYCVLEINGEYFYYTSK